VCAEQADERCEVFGIEAIVGLVEDEQLWWAEERGAEAGAAALAERHLVERFCAELVEAEGFDQGRRRGLAVAGGGGERPELDAGEEARWIGSLGDVAERGAGAGAVGLRAPDARVVDRDRAGVGGEDAGDRGEERGLAAAVLADDTDELAGVGVEGERGENRAATAADREIVDDEEGAQRRELRGAGRPAGCARRRGSRA
jgi:hypothetical protein